MVLQVFQMCGIGFSRCAGFPDMRYRVVLSVSSLMYTVKDIV